MRFLILIIGVFTISSCFSQVDVEKVKWIHGSEDCRLNKDPFAQVVQYDSNTYIIRQNKCLNYEAPFLYLFIGELFALLVDTGAKADEGSFPLYDMVAEILDKKSNSLGRTVPLKVVHSHGHGDHKANDFQFVNKQNVELVAPTMESNIQFFNINDWPNQSVIYNLGNRQLTIIPIPGHDLISIAIYDSQTRWLLTGDTVYPGRLYVRDWVAFKKSIDRLSTFCKTHKVSFLMGNHIEMADRPGVDYPTGTTFHPHEHILPLRISVLDEIQNSFKGKETAPKRDVHPDFIIEAVN